MYKWKIEIMLKNGEVVSGIHKGNENDSHSVAKTLLGSSRPNDFCCLYTLNETGSIFIRVCELVTMTVIAI